jgi:hypothetical protein
MKKLFIIPLILLSCSSDDIAKDPCECIAVDDPFTHNATVNGVTTFTTHFNGLPICDTIVIQMHYVTTNPNYIPKDGECFKNN